MSATELSRALEEVLAGLNPPQREAVEHGEGPLLIFAGAGSGKTRVLTARVAHLIAQHRVWPDRLLAVTFTNRAALEMRRRVAEMVGEEAGRMWVGTFHHTAVRMLRRDAERIGLPRGFLIFDDEDTNAALRRVLDDLSLDPKRYPVPGLAAQISRAKTELLGPDEYPSRNYRDEIARRVYTRYEELLRRFGGLDFDDLILQAVRLLQSDEESRLRWRDRFRHVLVDEYQDTNRSQYVLVKLLAEEHRNLAVVGDDDQSIYGFRGADVRNILDFKKDYPDAHVVNLEQNYRSSQPILDAAYHVIVQNPARAPKRLWTDRGGGDRVTALQAYNEVEEAEFVADEIDRLRRLEKRPHSDFAVLYRTNAQSRAFEEVFGRRRIPFRLVGGVRFWERREVKDLLAYLRFLHNPADAISFARLANVPRRKIGPATVEKVTAQAAAGGGDIMTVLAVPAAVPGLQKASVTALQQLQRELESLRATLRVLAPSELVEQVMEVVGLEAHYQDGTPQGDARLENLRELKGMAEEFDAGEDPSARLEAFLTEVALVSDVDSYDEEGEGVTLITLHMVKGLEFGVVFLAGLEEGLLPHQRSLDEGSEEAMAEERRLAYVGITRARDRLYLTCAFRRRMFGQAQAAFPSRFLADIPQAVLRAPGRGAAPVAPPRMGGYREKLVERQVRAAPAPPPVQRYKEGERVSHPSFGDGVVIKSTLTRTDEELLVKFDRSGLKILSGTLAPLSRP